MLVVKVEIWPGGEESRKEEIGVVSIANVSNLTPESDYVYSIEGIKKNQTRASMKVAGKVVGHKRKDGAFELLRRVLENALLGV